jgi:hypothetical protein
MRKKISVSVKPGNLDSKNPRYSTPIAHLDSIGTIVPRPITIGDQSVDLSQFFQSS